MNRKEAKKVKKKRRSILKRLLFLTLLVIIGVGAYAGYLSYKTIQAANESYNELERGTKSKLREVEVSTSKDPISILLLGVEDYSSGGTQGRTDTIIVATMNPEDSTMKMVSIPRDTRVYVESEGKEDKINHAYVFGGKDGTIDAVEELLDIPIDYYAEVNFNGFKEIIDEIGGITVDVPFDFWEKSDVDNEKIYFTEGEMTLNGEEALAYARMRKRDPMGDFGRNERQQQIISASIDSLLSPNNLLKLDAITEHVSQNVETNMRLSEALGIQQNYKSFNSKSIEKLKLEGSDEYLNGIYYYAPDEVELENLKDTLKVHLGLIEETTNTDNGTIDEEYPQSDEGEYGQ
ncbi:MAG TPA: LCP family protein [Niallia sp.]|nr:LCP family protein [Niallia sp.]